jgi:hypothetical protein
MQIRDALLDKNIKKVVVVAHSEGGIIISSALDNLLSDLPRECPQSIAFCADSADFQQLEIYTFACAASHFNNPQLLTDVHSKAAVSYLIPLSAR